MFDAHSLCGAGVVLQAGPLPVGWAAGLFAVLLELSPPAIN